MLSSFAWETHQSLRENILGLQKRKNSLEDTTPPPPFSSLSPVNVTTQAPVTSQEVDLCTGSVSYGYPVMQNQMAADSRLQGRKTRAQFNSNLMYYWRKRSDRKKVKGQKRVGVICGLANRGGGVKLWKRGCKVSHLMYEHS